MSIDIGELVGSLFANSTLRKEEIVINGVVRKSSFAPAHPPTRPPLNRILFLGRRASNDDKTTNQSIPPFSISIIFPFFIHHLLLNPADHFFPPREEANRYIEQEEPLSDTAPDPCRGAILQFPDRIGHRLTRQPRRRRRRRRRRRQQQQQQRR